MTIMLSKDTALKMFTNFEKDFFKTCYESGVHLSSEEDSGQRV